MPSPIDTSMYGTGFGAAPGGQGNALGMLGQAVGIQNQMAQGRLLANQNLLFQQQNQARMVMGQIMDATKDPQTGQPNFKDAAIRMSTNPVTAPFAPAMINQWITNENLQQDTAQKALANTKTRVDMLGSAAAPIAMKMADGSLGSDPKNPNSYDLTELQHQVASVMGQDPEISKEALDFLVSVKGMKSKPEQMAALVNLTKQAQVASHGLDGVLSTFMQDVGPNIATGVQDKLTGAVNQTGSLAKGLTPSEYYTPQAGVAQQGNAQGLPLGTPTVTPRGAAFGLPAPGALTQQGWSAGMPPISGSPQGQGGGMGAPNALGVAPRASGVVPTGLAQGQSEAISNVMTKYLPDLQQRVQTANGISNLLNQISVAKDGLHVGGGASTFAEMGKLAQAAGAPPAVYNALANGGLDPSQEVMKLFMQVGSALAGNAIHAQGGRMTQTEWTRMLSEGAPNIDMSLKGLNSITTDMRQQLGLVSKENEAWNQKYQRYMNGTYDISKFPNKWNATLAWYLAHPEKAAGASNGP